MKCSSPLHCFFDDYATQLDGKKHLNFVSAIDYDKIQESSHIHKLELPCGHCIECRINKAQDWSVRSVLESYNFRYNWFITLTYDEDNIKLIKTVSRLNGKLGIYSNLEYRDIQLFLKRLRKYFKDNYNHDNIRFLVSGEYGDLSGRAHWHILLFNLPLEKRDLHVRKIDCGHIYFDSPLIKKLWPFGNNLITDLNLCTSSYVARYVLKKFYGDYESSYQDLCKYYNVQPQNPERISMSRKPGIAHSYFENTLTYQDFLYFKKIMFENGKQAPIPDYFKRIFKERPEELSNYEEFSNLGIEPSAILECATNAIKDNIDLYNFQIQKQTTKSLDEYNETIHQILLDSIRKRDFI